MNKTLGSISAVAAKDTIIMPKKIIGYKTPEGQILKEDGQIINFIYKPIHYPIAYKLGGGIFKEFPKDNYTIEEEYTPPTPIFGGHKFLGWEPEKIEIGTVGLVTFKAKWETNPILLKGKDLNLMIDKYFGKEKITSIKVTNKFPSAKIPIVNLSCTDNPIYSWLTKKGVLYLFAKDDIYCNQDMIGAFEGFTLLSGISCFNSFIYPSQMNIKSIFKDCTVLADVSPADHWDDTNLIDFTDAFKNTSAAETGRVPSWYRWEVKVHYLSKTGKELETELNKYIPDQTIYPKSITGYKSITESLVVTSKDLEYTFIYEPIEYSIDYETDGGELLNAKNSYTIEDATYYPPEPYKYGYKFVGWNPECIKQGEYGNASFIAKYEIK